MNLNQLRKIVREEVRLALAMYAERGGYERASAMGAGQYYEPVPPPLDEKWINQEPE